MTWVKLDDGFDEHVKVAALSDAAFRVCVKAICWCARKETDGRLPKNHARSLGPPRSIKELVAAGLWIETESGFEVKDFLVYNPSHAQLIAKREGTNGRVGRHRGPKNSTSNGVTQPTSNGPCNGATNDVANGVGTRDLPSPDPRSATTSQIYKEDPELSDPSEPSDLTGTARETESGRLSDRLVQLVSGPGEPPKPRKDPLCERVAFADWFPSTDMLVYCRASGLTDADFDVALTEARDGLMGRHDFEWFDVKIWRYLDVAIDRKKNPRRMPPGAVAHASRPPDEPLPSAPAHESFEDQERAHAGRLAKALAGEYGEKLKRAAPDMPASRLRAIVEEFDRKRPQALGAVLPKVGRTA